jgi:hypothetical protein
MFIPLNSGISRDTGQDWDPLAIRQRHRPRRSIHWATTFLCCNVRCLQTVGQQQQERSEPDRVVYRHRVPYVMMIQAAEGATRPVEGQHGQGPAGTWRADPTLRWKPLTVRAQWTTDGQAIQTQTIGP